MRILGGRGTLPGRTSEAAQGRQGDDLRLIALVEKGDLAAFEELYRIYHPRLTRFLVNLVRRPQTVEEVLNDTMMVVWERAGTFNGASKLSTWIFAIAYRKALRALRRHDEAIEDPDPEKRVSLDASPEEEFGQRTLQKLLAEAMAGLSPDHRTVLHLTYFHELEYREIARIMDCPVDTVKTRMFHARRNLRRRMGGELADWL